MDKHEATLVETLTGRMACRAHIRPDRKPEPISRELRRVFLFLHPAATFVPCEELRR